ncbi:MAG: hypothetical protein ACRENP_07005 [Longimicrobiales bacterium]
MKARIRTFVTLIGALAVWAACRDQPSPEPQAQAAPEPPQPVADTAPRATVPVGWPNNPKAPVPGTVGDGTVGTKITVDIKDRKLTLSQAEMPGGPVSFQFTNSDNERHILEITWEYGARWRSVPVGKGGSVIMSQSLRPGPYEIYCYVPGHKARGEKFAFAVR